MRKWKLWWLNFGYCYRLFLKGLLEILNKFSCDVWLLSQELNVGLYIFEARMWTANRCFWRLYEASALAVSHLFSGPTWMTWRTSYHIWRHLFCTYWLTHHSLWRLTSSASLLWPGFCTPLCTQLWFYLSPVEPWHVVWHMLSISTWLSRCSSTSCNGNITAPLKLQLCLHAHQWSNFLDQCLLHQFLYRKSWQFDSWSQLLWLRFLIIFLSPSWQMLG